MTVSAVAFRKTIPRNVTTPPGKAHHPTTPCTARTVEMAVRVLTLHPQVMSSIPCGGNTEVTRVRPTGVESFAGVCGC